MEKIAPAGGSYRDIPRPPPPYLAGIPLESANEHCREFLEAALPLARARLRGAPVAQRSNRPLPVDRSDDATMEETTMRRRAERCPTANVGFAIEPGLVVVDISHDGGPAPSSGSAAPAGIDALVRDPHAVAIPDGAGA